jgi:hypothetical protein
MSSQPNQPNRASEQDTERAWGTNARGDVGDQATQGGGSGVGGASLAGTPAGSARDSEIADGRGGTENAEAETSGLTPPEGTSVQSSGSGTPSGPGAFTDDASAPPVYDL